MKKSNLLGGVMKFLVAVIIGTFLGIIVGLLIMAISEMF